MRVSSQMEPTGHHDCDALAGRDHPGGDEDRSDPDPDQSDHHPRDASATDRERSVQAASLSRAMQ